MNKRLKLDFNSVIGILLAFVAIIGGQMLEGGHISSLIQAAAFLIVMGGTVGAVLLQSPVKVFLNGISKDGDGHALRAGNEFKGNW